MMNIIKQFYVGEKIVRFGNTAYYQFKSNVTVDLIYIYDLCGKLNYSVITLCYKHGLFKRILVTKSILFYKLTKLT